MSVARVTEIKSSSTKSFDDAIRTGKLPDNTTVTSFSRLTSPIASITARLPSPSLGRCMVITACSRPMPPWVMKTRRTAGITLRSCTVSVAPMATAPIRQCSSA